MVFYAARAARHGLKSMKQESLAAEALDELRCSARGVGSLVFTGRVWRAAPIRPVVERIEKERACDGKRRHRG